jgi:G3E family GTPase
VLTGALGAGKTTLLNALLRHPEMAGTAVVVNEFGAVGIDHELIEAATEDIVLLPSGCVCCQVRADLAEALLRLDRGARRGELPAFQRVVVETSGLAAPGPILQLFVESPALRGRFRLEALVTLVDAQLGFSALEDQSSPPYRQVLLADRLLVSKFEYASAEALATLEARLAGVNPYAEHHRAEKNTANPAWFEAASVPTGHTVPPEALHASHDESIESFVLRWQDPQPLAALGDWLLGLGDSFGARLLRVKGIVAVQESSQRVALHAVQHLVSPPEFLPGQAAESRVVFITRGLEPGDVRPPWPAAVEIAGTSPPSSSSLFSGR